MHLPHLPSPITRSLRGTALAVAASTLLIGTASAAGAVAVKDPGKDVDKSNGWSSASTTLRKMNDIRKVTALYYESSDRVAVSFKVRDTAPKDKTFDAEIGFSGYITVQGKTTPVTAVGYLNDTSRNEVYVGSTDKNCTGITTVLNTTQDTIGLSFPAACVGTAKKITDIYGGLAITTDDQYVGVDRTDLNSDKNLAID